MHNEASPYNSVSEFSIVLLFILAAVAFIGLVLFLNRLIRPNRPNEEKSATYECGEDTIGTAWTQFNIRFYIVALIFLLFEVELVFLFPWSVVFGNAALIEESEGLWGWFAVTEVFIFVGLLLLGLAYAWKRRYLEWIKPQQKVVNISSPVPSELYDKVNRKYSS